jgi:hypothetical protein
VRKLMTMPSLPSLYIFPFLAPRPPYLFRFSSYEPSAMSYEPLAGWNELFCYGGLKRFYQTIEQTGEAEPGSLPSGFHVSVGEGRKK